MDEQVGLLRPIAGRDAGPQSGGRALHTPALKARGRGWYVPVMDRSQTAQPKAIGPGLGGGDGHGGGGGQDDGASRDRDEAALVAAVATGDRPALAELYDRHASRLAALVAHILRDPAQAEDVVHDVFVEVWHHAHAFDPGRGSVRAWLTVRARSRALDRLGRRTRGDRAVARTGAEAPADGGPSGPHEAETLYDAGVLRHSMLALPEELACLLQGAYYEGMSAAELAARFGLPVGTVKSRLARAISALRQRLEVVVPSGGVGGDA
jgi:RNA polymerase sigma-70 factor (ECF subfamily)